MQPLNATAASAIKKPNLFIGLNCNRFAPNAPGLRAAQKKPRARVRAPAATPP
jgi:hypothetical protein